MKRTRNRTKDAAASRRRCRGQALGRVFAKRSRLACAVVAGLAWFSGVAASDPGYPPTAEVAYFAAKAAAENTDMTEEERHTIEVLAAAAGATAGALTGAKIGAAAGLPGVLIGVVVGAGVGAL